MKRRRDEEEEEEDDDDSDDDDDNDDDDDKENEGPRTRLNESRIVWISRLTDPEEKFDPNHPPIEGWTLFINESSPSLWNCTDLGREDAELHKRIRVSAVTAEVSSQTLLDLYESESDQVREEFLFCTGQNEERLFLSRKAEDEDPWYCGGRDDCKPGKQRGRYINSK